MIFLKLDQHDIGKTTIDIDSQLLILQYDCIFSTIILLCFKKGILLEFVMAKVFPLLNRYQK